MAAITAFLNSDEAGRLKAELQNLRRKGALKPSADWDSTTPDPDRSCGRCRVELGRVINRGAYCRSCRLKVCKGCREYSFRTTDWVCTVCHKRMEIQAASGEWMNEFVRRPSRRRDNRVYVPAADIIKRTIRRSWTISNPTPRWTAPRTSPLIRPYSSLPRGQDINDYPSLVSYKNAQPVAQQRKHSPAHRSHSEDVYNEREEVEAKKEPSPKPESKPVGQRVNPLTKAAQEGKLTPAVAFEISVHKEKKKSDDERSSPSPNKPKEEDVPRTPEKKIEEKRVSFEENTPRKSKDEEDLKVKIKQKDKSILKPISKSLDDTRPERKMGVHPTHSLPEDGISAAPEVRYAKEEDVPTEQCDIEPLSGTVFRKVTVRRRRQDMRKVPAIDNGWRRGPDSDILDVLLPEGDDYKLVFISSDSSSKEEDVDDNDSSSTASSFLIDDCDWDYFEPSTGTRPLLNWSSPFGSPGVYRRSRLESPLGSPLVYRRAKESDTGTDEDIPRLDSGSPASSDSTSFLRRETEDHTDRNEPTMEDISLQCVHQPEGVVEPPRKLCQSCGSPTQYVPFPVPVPIPFPVPALWTTQGSLVRYSADLEPLRSRFRSLPRSLWPYVSHALIWPLITAGEFSQSECAPDSASVLASPERNEPAAADPFVSHPDKDTCAEREREAGEIAEAPHENSAAESTPAGSKPEAFMSKESATPYEVVSNPELGGHLASENANMSSGESSDTDDSDDSNKPRVRRIYNVSGGDVRESDDALPSSEVSDSEEDGRMSQSSVREDDMSSSGSADTDSNDTGTVADQKSKRFSRVLIVNNNVSSSSTSSCSSDASGSEDSESDTSDNDTDTEKDCGVVLTRMKMLPESDVEIRPKEESAVIEDKQTVELMTETSERDCVSDFANSAGDFKECLTPSPGLSDVSAESHHSSDAEEPDKGQEVHLPASDSSSFINNNVSTSASIRSDEPVEGTENHRGERAGVSVASELDGGAPRHAARYTSLVMITQEPAPTSYPQVSVVTSDTTTLVPDSDIVVRHTNWQEIKATDSSWNSPPKTPVFEDNDVTVVDQQQESVTVVTGADTLSAVVSLEDGLADDDSWVENLSNDEDELTRTSASEDSSSGDEVTLTCTAAIDQEDELRGYHRSAIDFTLHTIVEESCEDSEVEQPTSKKIRPTSATDLEKYFFFGLGDGNAASIHSNRDDGLSETSSICSEGMDSLGGPEEIVSNDSMDPAELASSRLEKYFLSGFMGFTAERRDSDGSVGSDSEGRPSPEQRRKRLVRARGTGRSHSSSLDNLLAETEAQTENQVNSEDLSSSDTDTNDEANNFEKSEGQFDTVKRKKNKKPRNCANGSNSSEDSKVLESTQEVNEDGCKSEEDGNKTPQPDLLTTVPPDSFNNRKQQSRDSGFIGSCDDLSKERESGDSLGVKTDLKLDLHKIIEEKKPDDRSTPLSTPPATSLTRKDSFNNWSSDEETNLMMCKMRQFFKTMIANSQNGPASKPTTPILGNHSSPKLVPSPRLKNRYKPPQLVYFENELTRLMKSVPGIRDDQVREIVEYLSSEDTWSDSYDSSDYTNSDLEGTAGNKSLLQQQISDSCKEIIDKFDNGEDREEKDDLLDEPCGLNRETAFVYQKLVASFEKIAVGDVSGVPHTPHSSPPLIAKVMHHIGSRLVALMHEVSSGESHASNSPKTRHYHRRLHPKLSNASSTTTEDDESASENLTERLNNLDETISAYNLLPRSRSHDLLLGETRTLHQSSSGVSDIAEERETSDYERFSWRGSFESALMATDSRNKLSLLGSEGSASASALAVAAKRRSAGDLMFSHKSLSREQLDRVRSCGSIGGGSSEDKLWVSSAVRPTRRRSSVPDAASGSGGSADGEDDDDDDDELENRATLPRSLQTSTATTNSLPRLPTTTTPSSAMHKAHSMYHFLQQNVKSARYRPPGFSKFSTSAPKRAVSAPGLQPSHQRRGRRSQQSVPSDDASISEANSSPMLVTRGISKSASPSPVAHSSRRDTCSVSSQEWHSNEEDIDRFVAIHHNRSSLSSLGLRSDSMASVYSGAGEGRYGTVAVRGQVEFGLQYNYKAGALEILIKQCKDLAAVDTKRNRSDPYVKVYLLPDKSKSGKRKTKVKKHTLNPVFDESLKFHISLNELETRTLWLTVWHSDMFGRNDFLGEVMMTLENKVFDEPTPKWYNLQERTEPFEDVLSFKGDILVGLKFVPPDMTVHKKGKRSRGALHVKVKEARSLTAVKANGTSDPFCKSYLLPDKGRSSKQKTAVIRKTVNAVWNHTFIYDDVTLQELSERCLELTVWDHDRLGSNEFLGGVRFSLGTGKHYGKSVDWMDSTGKELSLWKSMLERPNFWVEGCLPLRPTLDHRAT